MYPLPSFSVYLRKIKLKLDLYKKIFYGTACYFVDVEGHLLGV